MENCLHATNYLADMPKNPKNSVVRSGFSITLDSDLVRWVDDLVKTKRFANRSHGIEFALNELKRKKS